MQNKQSRQKQNTKILHGENKGVERNGDGEEEWDGEERETDYK